VTGRRHLPMLHTVACPGAVVGDRLELRAVVDERLGHFRSSKETGQMECCPPIEAAFVDARVSGEQRGEQRVEPRDVAKRRCLRSIGVSVVILTECGRLVRGEP
jgi:hypothetical protein